MISLLSILKRFWHVMKGGWGDREFRGLSIVLGSWVALGTIIYSVYEDWSIVESLYFCVMTLTTIGYGDLTPTTPLAKVVTIFYGLNGVIILLTLFDVVRRVLHFPQPLFANNAHGHIRVSIRVGVS